MSCTAPGGAQRVERDRSHVLEAHPLPRNTGPSAHALTILVEPSSPMTGSTHVMHTPMPQAIASSTATCTGMSNSIATAVTARSVSMGAQA
ncbi:hypothetical protein GCM10020001_081810 [Nonomuraea salmonea]